MLPVNRVAVVNSLQYLFGVWGPDPWSRKGCHNSWESGGDSGVLQTDGTLVHHEIVKSNLVAFCYFCSRCACFCQAV